LSHAWNAFRKPGGTGEDFFQLDTASYGSSYSGSRPDRRLTLAHNNRDIVNSIYNKIGMDVASILLRHVKLDANGRYSSTVPSGLNYCLTRKANIDQAAQAFRLDMALTLLQKGHIAVVPVDTTVDPSTGSYDIKTLRVGEVVRWFPQHVRVKLWNDQTGTFGEITIHKDLVAIAENPFYEVMNEPNSTLQRLARKLSLLDAVEEQAGSGKLDLIIQLPYAIKSDARIEQAERRRKDIEVQLKDSKYGIAYADATEKITQLNRPAENNMLGSVEYLTAQLYNQLGLTDAILNGTADEKTMLNYQNRLVIPVLNAIKEALINAFLTKTAITQGHLIESYRDAFSLVPVSQIADIADKLGRNEVLSSNEIRGILGFAPSDDPKADQLHNSNMPSETEDLGELKPVKPDADQLAIEQRKT
jgi:hypothetical protein